MIKRIEVCDSCRAEVAHDESNLWKNEMLRLESEYVKGVRLKYLICQYCVINKLNIPNTRI